MLLAPDLGIDAGSVFLGPEFQAPLTECAACPQPLYLSLFRSEGVERGCQTAVGAARAHSDSAYAGLRVRRLGLQAGPGGSARGPGGAGEAWPRPRAPLQPLPPTAGAVTCAPRGTGTHTDRDRHTGGRGEDAWARTVVLPFPSAPLLLAPGLAAWPKPLTPKAILAVALPWDERQQATGSQDGPRQGRRTLFLAASGDCPCPGQVPAPGPQHHATYPTTNFFTEAVIYMHTGFCPFCPRPSFAAYLRMYPSMI